MMVGRGTFVKSFDISNLFLETHNATLSLSTASDIGLTNSIDPDVPQCQGYGSIYIPPERMLAHHYFAMTMSAVLLGVNSPSSGQPGLVLGVSDTINQSVNSSIIEDLSSLCLILLYWGAYQPVAKGKDTFGLREGIIL
jgi:hypothetical protein